MESLQYIQGEVNIFAVKAIECGVKKNMENTTKSAVVNTKQCTLYVVSIRLLCSLQISKT